MRVNLSYRKTDKHLEDILVNDQRVGTLRFWPASKEEPHCYEFKDLSTGVYGMRTGLYKKEFKELLQIYYNMKHRSVGHVKANDEESFKDELKAHNIFNYRNELNTFFFFHDCDLLAARMLV